MKKSSDLFWEHIFLPAQIKEKFFITITFGNVVATLVEENLKIIAIYDVALDCCCLDNVVL